MRGCIILATLAACIAASLAAAVDGEGTTTTAWPWETTTPEWETTTTDDWGTTTTVDPTACPPGWVNAVEGCFLFHYTEMTTWANAQYECEKLGAFLAEPQTEEQVSLLVSLAVLEQALLGTEEWWIGLTDQSHEGRWMWTHSVSNVTYTNWAAGSPSDTDVNPDDCALMSGKYGYSWEDTLCTGGMASPICQRMTPVTPTTTVPTSTTTTAIEESTTSYDRYHVELRGGYVGDDEAWGNVYAVNSQGVFGPVCDDGWGWNEAYVVCNQLGYHTDYLFSCGSAYGPVDTDFAMDDVICDWDNGHLQDCDYNLAHNCGADEGAGVHCSNNYMTTTAYPGADCGGGASTTTTTTTWSPEQ